LLAWGLILLSAIPFAMWWSYGETLVGISAGIFFKQRLLLGTLKLEQDQIRYMGSGQFMGYVHGLEWAESRAFDDALMVITAIMDVSLATLVLAYGVGGWSHAGLLALWSGLTLLIGWFYMRLHAPWHDIFMAMTSGVVEGMLAQQTRLAQEARSRWHDRDDMLLTRYLKLSEQRSRLEAILFTMSRGWLVVGLAAIAPQIIALSPRSLPLLAVSIGGILLAMQGLEAMCSGLDNVVMSATGLRKARMLFESASRPRLLPAVWVAEEKVPTDKSTVLLARDLVFRYRPGGRTVLQGCSLRVERGERILLEGPSGGGKSTLAAVLAGLRRAEHGMLLLWDFDQKTLGEDNWRRRVVATPQFHENHIFSETLAFNLLLSRRWPPTAEDLADAERICRELGLGAVLDRMPAGLHQLVGERGWRLSHGERSRIYIARALLQRADLVILDESFGSLDPENLSQAMRCVIAHAPTLIVIAHP
jgi:ATP-binding cassette subfamily B protein